MTDLSTSVEQIAALRHRLESQKADYEDRKQAFAFEVAPLTTQIEILREQLDVLEAEVRQEAEDAYRLTGEKEPGPGLSVKIRKKLNYDESKAIAWGLEKNLAVKTTLDKRLFEKLAKDTKPDFVEFVDTPTCYISTKKASAVQLDNALRLKPVSV